MVFRKRFVRVLVTRDLLGYAGVIVGRRITIVETHLESGGGRVGV